MKQICVALLLLAPAPATLAQQVEDLGPSMMERGAELFFRGLREEIGPALDELQELADGFGPAMGSFLEEMGPALGEIIDEVRDWTAYHPPEILPNGDIIIRRRDPIEPEPDPEIGPDTLPSQEPDTAIDL